MIPAPMKCPRCNWQRQSSEEEVRRAVDDVLAQGIWPIYETYEDAGLEPEQYVEFARAVLALLRSKQPEPCHEPIQDTETSA